jgi:hypothetical protein
MPKRVPLQIRITSRPQVDLSIGKVAPSTEIRYHHACRHLQLFITFWGGPPIQQLITDSALQALLVWVLFYLQVGYDTGTLGLADAANTLCGLKRILCTMLLTVYVPGSPIFVPDLFKPLWFFYSKWKAVEPYEFRLPVPLMLFKAMTGVCMTAQWRLMALFLSLGFWCLMRPGEMLALCHNDFWQPAEQSSVGIIRIRNPKIKRIAVQHVVVEQKWLLCLCKLCFQPHVGHVLIFPWSQWHLQKCWSQVLRVLKVGTVNHQALLLSPGPDKAWSPAGLRAGGATWDYICFQNLDRLMWRGRWASMTVLQHYVQLGTFHVTQHFHQPHTLRLLLHYSKQAEELLGIPPPP